MYFKVFFNIQLYISLHSYVIILNQTNSCNFTLFDNKNAFQINLLILLIEKGFFLAIKIQ